MIKNLLEKESHLVYRVLSFRRIVKVLKHEKRFQFRVLVVVGDQLCQIGLAMGKSKNLKIAIKKAILKAKKNLFFINLTCTKTIVEPITIYYKACKVVLKPAKQDHGLISGYPMRIILELGGIKNIITKSFGSRNTLNVSKATLLALKTFEI